MQPLASAGSARSQSGTNLSTSVGLSLFDSNGHELTIRADPKHPIELMVPRDSNVFIPPMAMQNVTSVDIAPHQSVVQSALRQHHLSAAHLRSLRDASTEHQPRLPLRLSFR